MKINWGTGIVLAFAAFISFILYFVFMAVSEKANHELVNEDYYKRELHYQDEIEAYKNVKELPHPPEVIQVKEGIKITFPNTKEDVTGTVSLYRPSNKKLDFDIPLRLSNSSMLIPNSQLLKGRWDVVVSWETEGKPYLIKEKIRY